MDDTRPDAWLDSIRIAKPCNERWEDMEGDDRVRNCARCELNVWNFAELTRAEAVALVAQRGGRLCGQLSRRADGTLLLRDCPTGLARARRRVALMAAGVVGVLAAAVGLVAAAVTGRKASPWSPTAGWTDHLPAPIQKVVKPFTPEPVRVMRGEICLPTPPAPASPAQKQ